MNENAEIMRLEWLTDRLRDELDADLCHEARREQVRNQLRKAEQELADLLSHRAKGSIG